MPRGRYMIRIIKMFLGVICSLLAIIFIVGSIVEKQSLWLIGTATFIFLSFILFRKSKKEKQKAENKKNY
mgnify:CR=1 FL=1